MAAPPQAAAGICRGPWRCRTAPSWRERTHRSAPAACRPRASTAAAGTARSTQGALAAQGVQMTLIQGLQLQKRVVGNVPGTPASLTRSARCGLLRCRCKCGSAVRKQRARVSTSPLSVRRPMLPRECDGVHICCPCDCDCCCDTVGLPAWLVRPPRWSIYNPTQDGVHV